MTTRSGEQDDSGCITSLETRQRSRVASQEADCGNQLQFFKDTPKEYDAWNIDPGTLDVPPERD